MTDAVDPIYLASTPTLDADHPAVRRFTGEAVGERTDPVNRAVALYLAVRDGIRYDPYAPFHLPEHYRASRVLEAGRGYCVQKAAVLAAAARTVEIPTRLAFATVRNHLATRQLLDYLGSDLFVYHGVVELYLEGQWVKATPAFNRSLCERHGTPPLEFDGRHDSIFQPYNEKNQKYMEYVADHGTAPDVPLEDLLAAWRDAYGADRVQGWIDTVEAAGALRPRRFEEEDVVGGR